MDKRLKIILVALVANVLIVIVYTIYLILTLESSAGIELLFYPFFLAGWLFFIESIVFTLIFIKHLKQIWVILLLECLLSSPVPVWFLNHWLDSLPVTIPKAGKLPVTAEEYDSLKKMIVQDFKLKDLDSNNVIIHEGVTVLKVDIDNIIYSFNKEKFFSLIIAEAKNGDKVKYCTAYHVGRKGNNGWELSEPSGNATMGCFDSIPELTNYVWQYFYKNYSINGSSDKPEIWSDKYIFNF